MIDNIQYISLTETLARVTKHPMLENVSVSDALEYTLDFIDEVGLPGSYEEKQALVPIKGFRGVLPCDLIDIIQVRDEKSGIPLRSMTDSFNTNSFNTPGGALTFKTSNRVITTSFEEGTVLISYHAIPVDEQELPMLPDDGTFQKALELYIKKEVFTVYFDQGKIRGDVLQKVETDYYWMKGRCRSKFRMPTVSEMETITGMMHRLIPSRNEFQHGFKGLGDREHFRRH